MGLDLSMVPPSQWDAVAMMLRSKPLLQPKPDERVVLSCRQTKNDKPCKYTFAAMSADGTSAKWDLTIPSYRLSEVIANMPRAGEERKALELFGEAKRASLPDAQAWLKLGRLLGDSGHYSDALDALDRAIGFSKKDPMMQFYTLTCKGHVLDLAGRRSEAIASYSDALKIDIGAKTMGYDWDITIDRKYVEDRLETPFQRK